MIVSDKINQDWDEALEINNAMPPTEVTQTHSTSPLNITALNAAHAKALTGGPQ